MKTSASKKLPIGIQSFEQISTEGFIYIDKTEHIYSMAEAGRFYFLSRPRRFGKSLLVSTLRCLFEARKELFKDLWILKNSDWEWKKRPVIAMDFNGIPHGSSKELEEGLTHTLDRNAAKRGLKLESPFLVTKFVELITKLRESSGEKVVILVDEYDKPIIDFLGKGENGKKIAIQNRDLLRNFYGVLKDADVAAALRFVFLTGVSKFSKVSIFSELNNLDDLTMHGNYSDMLGYTQSELEKYFPERINRLAKENKLSEEQALEKLKLWFNGYRFSESDIYVYNPFSILKCFNENDFKNYWFETGTPSFLVNLLKKKNYYLPNLENLTLTSGSFSTYEIEKLKVEALLFQTGYLTIKDINRPLYTLSYPNQEVRSSFLEHLFESFSGIENEEERSRFVLLFGYLVEGAYDDFFRVARSIFASIPYPLSSGANEAYFHTLFYLMLCASGMKTGCEVLTSRGRIDLLIELKDKVYIVEFKCDQSAEKGIKQIKDRKYHEKYLETGKELYLMGINFSVKERNIKDWEVEKYGAQEGGRFVKIDSQNPNVSI